MARIRSLHPRQWTDEHFVSCSPFARLLALGLRNEADDQGIFEWKPLTIKMRLFPADDVDVEALLSELEEFNQVKSYEHKGRKFGVIRNFVKYQRPKSPNFVHFMPPDLRNYAGYEDDISEPLPNNSGNLPAEEGGRRKEVNSTDDFFETFWKIYPPRLPHQNPKKPAKLKFAAAVKRGVDPQTIIDGATRYAAYVDSEETDPQFIKQAVTWLNQECWDAVIEIKKKAKY